MELFQNWKIACSNYSCTAALGRHWRLLDGVGGWVAGRVFVVYGAPLDVCGGRWGAPCGRGGGDGSEGGQEESRTSGSSSQKVFFR